MTDFHKEVQAHKDKQAQEIAQTLAAAFAMLAKARK